MNHIAGIAMYITMVLRSYFELLSYWDHQGSPILCNRTRILRLLFVEYNRSSRELSHTATITADRLLVDQVETPNKLLFMNLRNS